MALLPLLLAAPLLLGTSLVTDAHAHEHTHSASHKHTHEGHGHEEHSHTHEELSDSEKLATDGSVSASPDPAHESFGAEETVHLHEHGDEAAAPTAEEHAHHGHSHGDGPLWERTWALITDPAHAITEIFYSLLFEVIAIPLAILAYKKLREPRLRRQIHAEIDAEHGVSHEPEAQPKQK